MKKSIFLSLITLTASLTASLNAHAFEEELKNYRGIRAAGMGGVQFTTGNYTEALFANPARLSEVDTWKLSILDLTTEVNSNVLSTSSDLTGLKGTSGSGTISAASKIIGKTEHVRAQIFTGYFNPQLIGETGFGLGFLVSSQVTVRANYTTDLDTAFVTDVGPVMGFSHKFLDDNLSVGVNLRAIYRAAVDQNISVLNFLTGQKLELKGLGKQGLGFDGDLGTYYHIPWELPFMRISVAASVNNLMKSHYIDAGDSVLSGVDPGPTNNDRTFNTGVRLDFPDTWIFTAPLFAFEFQDVGDTTKRMTFFKTTHFGGEAKISRVFSIRAGLYQGYASAGLGIDLPVLKLDLATYGEELGTNAGTDEDRRFLFRLAFEI